jgi:hypothetical protein
MSRARTRVCNLAVVNIGTQGKDLTGCVLGVILGPETGGSVSEAS